MNRERLEETVSEHFQDEITDDRNLYFKTYYSNKSVTSIDFGQFFAERLDTDDIEVVIDSEDEVIIQTDGQKLVIFSLPYENWLLVYSSALPEQIRKNLGRLSSRVGWLMDAWVPSETVEGLYEDYSNERDKVRIKRRWDPYYLYQNYSKVPPEMQEYYEEHLNSFEKQKTEFSLNTPRWMVDEVMNTRLKEDFLERSEVAESRFDVHLSNPGDAGVTVDQNGAVTHTSGTPHATIKVVDDVIGRNEQLHREFSEVVPQNEYEVTDGGMVGLREYRPPKILRLTFPQRTYNEEASIKLSNLLTVGQNDAKLHGFISSRDDLEFRCRTYIIFDRSEYEILFTEYEGDPTLYVRPVEATVDGIIYLYHRLKSKFDTRIEREVLEETEFSLE